MNNAAGTRCRTKKRGFPTAERVLQLDLLHSCCRELESIDPATLLQSPWEIASRGGSVLTRPKRKMSWQRRTSVQTPLRSKKKKLAPPIAVGPALLCQPYCGERKKKDRIRCKSFIQCKQFIFSWNYYNDKCCAEFLQFALFGHLAICTASVPENGH